MPEEVRGVVGHSLRQVQHGETPESATKMKGKLREVMEIRVNEDGDTYRTMYTVVFEGLVYVLDAFKKKSKKGIATPKADIDRIEQRLKAARIHYQGLERAN